jgi:hypothetical protein
LAVIGLDYLLAATKRHRQSRTIWLIARSMAYNPKSPHQASFSNAFSPAKPALRWTIESGIVRYYQSIPNWSLPWLLPLFDL